MSSLTTILSALGASNTVSAASQADIPVGGLQWMPVQYPDAQFTDDAARTFQRTGTATPYVSPDHVTAVAKGFGISKWLRSFDTNYVTYNLYNSLVSTPGQGARLYAFGEHGTLVQVSITQGRNDYEFHNAAMVAAGARPKIVQIPNVAVGLDQANSTGRSNIGFIPGLGLWVYVEQRLAVGGTGYSQTFRIMLSADGLNWKETSYTSTQSAPSANYSLQIAGFGDCLAVSFQNNNNNGSSGIDFVKLDSTGRVILSRTVAQGVGNVALQTAGDDDLLLAYIDANASVFAAYGFTAALAFATSSGMGGAVWSYTPGNYYSPSSLIAHRKNGQLVVTFKPTGMIWGSATGTLANLASASGYSLLSNDTGGLVHTGAYWLCWNTNGSSAYLNWSTNGTSWTARQLSANGVTGVTRSHVACGSGGVVSLLTNTVDTTSSLSTSGTLTSPDTIIGLVEFNGILVAVTTSGAIVTSSDNGASWERRYQAPASGINPFNVYNHLEICNGRIFLMTASAGSTLHSADGINWTRVDFSSTWNGVADYVEYSGGFYVFGGASAGGAHGVRSADLTTFATFNVGNLAGNGWNLIGLQSAGSNLVAWVYGANRAYYSSNGGQTWTAGTGGSAFTQSSNSPMIIRPYYDASTGTAYAFSASSTGGAGIINRMSSTDGGVTWTLTAGVARAVPANYVVFSVKKFSNLLYAIVGSSGSASQLPGTQAGILLSSADNGLTWSVVPLPTFGIVSGATSHMRRLEVYGGGTQLAYGCVFGASYVMTIVDATASATMVGTEQRLERDGTVAYVRIK